MRKKARLPPTRENYLAIAYPDGMPEELDTGTGERATTGISTVLKQAYQAGRISDEVRAAFWGGAAAVRNEDGAGDRGQPQPRGAG